MYEYIMRKEVVEDLKSLIERVEDFDKNEDFYCELMRNFIINSYCEN